MSTGTGTAFPQADEAPSATLRSSLTPILSVRVAAIAALAVGFAAALFLHVPGLNGPAYWAWQWRALDVAPLAAAFAVALLPFAAGQALRARDRLSTPVALRLAMASLFLVQLVFVGMQESPFHLAGIARIVANPDATSYFTDAWSLAGTGSLQWIADFPQISSGLHLHSLTKPPGPVLYYFVLIRLFGPEAAAAIGGLLVGVAATATIPATAWLVRALTGERDAGAEGASFLAVSAALAVFFPELDQVYPVLACGVLGLWAIAVRTGRASAAAASGLVLAIACFFTYAFFVLGAFLVGYTLLAPGASATGRLREALRLLAAAAAAFVAFYVVMWLALGFDPVSTFFAALRNQDRLLGAIPRPYPATILFDLTDFAMGLCWIGALLALLGVFRREGPMGRWLPALCLGEIAVVAVTALLPGETIRVWMFLLPLAAVPIGRELSRWTPAARMLAYACAAVVTFAIGRNLQFIV